MLYSPEHLQGALRRACGEDEVELLVALEGEIDHPPIFRAVFDQ